MSELPVGTAPNDAADRIKEAHAAGVAEGRAEVAADRDEAWAAYRAAIGVPESQHQRERMERIALHAEQVEAENVRLRAALAGTSPQGEGRAEAWDEGWSARAEYENRRDVPLDWPDRNPYRAGTSPQGEQARRQRANDTHGEDD